jgi:hypothetical protein
MVIRRVVGGIWMGENEWYSEEWWVEYGWEKMDGNQKGGGWNMDGRKWMVIRRMVGGIWMGENGW